MPPPAEGLASRLFLGPALRTQPDRRLVTLVRDGYEAAFEEIVRRYGRPLSRYAASIVGGRSEDVTQDAFSKALLALRRDDAEIDLRPWLFRIVRNTALNDLRDSPPTPELLAEALAGGRDPAEELERREELADLIKRLRALPEPQRAAIVMRELEGLGHEEIAAALGLSGGAARQAIHRARQALRDGVGMLLPLPLLRLLIDHGEEAAGAGAGAGGAIAAAGGAGAGGALKVGAVAAVLAGSVGTGVALQHHRGDETAGASTIPAAKRAAPSPASPPPSAAVTALVEGSQHDHDGSGGSDDSGHDTPHGEDPGEDGHGMREHAAVNSFDGGGGGGPGPSQPGPPHRDGHHGEDGGGDRGGHGDTLEPGRHGEHSGPGGGGEDGFTSEEPREEHGGGDSSDPHGEEEHHSRGGGPGPPPPPPIEAPTDDAGDEDEGSEGASHEEIRDLRP